MLAFKKEDEEQMKPLLINGRTAARMLGVSERTLWSLTDEGKLPCVRIRRSVRYAVSDLEIFVDKAKSERE